MLYTDAIHPAQLKVCTHWTETLHFHSSEALAATILLSGSEFDFSRYLIQAESCGICPSVADMFHLVLCPPGSSHPFQQSTLLDLPGFPFYLKTDYYCIVHHILHILSSINRQLGCFYILALRIRLQWTWEFRSTFKMLISVSLVTHPEMELLDPMIVSFLFLFFEKSP